MNTFLKNSLRILGLLLVISLAACSDNDNDISGIIDDIIDDDSPPSSTSGIANGVWLGKVTMDSGEPVDDITGILYGGKIMFIDEDGIPTQSMVDGTYEVDGDKISGTALMYEATETDGVVGDLDNEPTLNFSGTVIEEESMSLDFEGEDGGSGSIEFTFQPDYNEPSSISFIEGEWDYAGSLTIDVVEVDNETGEFYGKASDSSCIVSGTISILDSEISLYWAVTTVEDCDEADGKYLGFSGVNSDDDPNVLTIIGANSEMFLAIDFNKVP